MVLSTKNNEMVTTILFFKHSENTTHLARNPANGGIPAKFKTTMRYIHFFLFSNASIEIFFIFDEFT